MIINCINISFYNGEPIKFVDICRQKKNKIRRTLYSTMNFNCWNCWTRLFKMQLRTELVPFSIFSRHLIRSVNAILLLQRKILLQSNILWEYVTKHRAFAIQIRTHAQSKLQPQIKQTYAHTHIHTHTRLKCQTVLKHTKKLVPTLFF